MPASPFDSEIYRGLLRDDEAAEIFSDAAELRAMMRVEGALAKVQGNLGLIPAASADAIIRAATELQLDPAGLSSGTAQAGVPVPAMVSAFRDAMDSPAHAQYLHWGATSQDIMDTGLVLRLAEVCKLVKNRIGELLQALARQAERHAELPMAARTRAQIATPTSFGAVVASWGAPLLDHLEALSQLEPRLLRVSLAGASGNSTALGERTAELRAGLARELGLGDTEFAWHSNRSALAEFSSLLTRVSGSLAKMGEDCMLANRSEVGELELSRGGGSSTMPQKNNPVGAESLVTLFHLADAMNGLMTRALLHRQQRDGVAWTLEWHALPQVCRATARALMVAHELVADLRPDAGAMAARLLDGYGLVYAEAISFELATVMPRPEAQDAVKRLCAGALKTKRALAELAAEKYPDHDWQAITNPVAQLGDAPDQARAFAARVRQL